MRILMVLANHRFPPDPRVAKEASVLISGGHDVTLLCLAGPDEAPREEVDGIDVVRFRPHAEATLARKLDSLGYLLTLSSAAWRRRIVELGREVSADAVHVHDMPQAKAASQAAADLGVPFVLDLHENYPYALRIYRRRRIDRLFIPPERMARLEQRLIARADRVLVVVEEAKDRLVELGAPADRVTVFGNAEPRPTAPPVALERLAARADETGARADETGAGTGETAASDARSFELVYFGYVDAHRGLDTVIEGMPALVNAVPHARLTIIGDGSTLEELRAAALASGVRDSIRFLGWMGAEEATKHLAQADVGLVPHHRSPHTDATMPHKVFQYMALGLPVVVSDCKPLERLVRSTDAGEVFVAGDGASFAEATARLADADRALQAGEAGYAAVRGDWNIEAFGERLLAAYGALG